MNTQVLYIIFLLFLMFLGLNLRSIKKENLLSKYKFIFALLAIFLSGKIIFITIIFLLLILSLLRFLYQKQKLNLFLSLIIGISAIEIYKILFLQMGYISETISIFGLGFCLIKFTDLLIYNERKINNLWLFILNDFSIYLNPFNMLAGPVSTFNNAHKSYKPKTNYYVLSRFSKGILFILVGIFFQDLSNESKINFLSISSSSSILIFMFSLLTSAISIYLIYAGYTDIAISSSSASNEFLPENFSKPFLKTNLIDFWKSWNMSVTKWVTGVIYLPAFVFLKERFPHQAKQFSTLTVFITIGLWHGISLSWFLWGLHQGIGWVITDGIMNKKKLFQIKIFNIKMSLFFKFIGFLSVLFWFSLGQLYVIYGVDNFNNVLNNII